MSDMRYLTENDVCCMMAKAAGRWGLTYDEADTLWRRDELDIPELRDIWLIWAPRSEGDT